MERKKVKPVKVGVKEEPKVTRTKAPEIPLDTRLRWQKIGGGSLRWRNKIIKPNEVFLAHREDLPHSFMDCLICLDSEVIQKEKIAVQEKASAPPVLYKLIELQDNLWDVVNEEGKAINENPLDIAQAEALLATLS